MDTQLSQHHSRGKSFSISVGPPLSHFARRIRWGAIALASAPLAGAFLYAATPFRFNLACPIRAWMGIPCPSCGLTRSFTAFADGDLVTAVGHHAFGPILFLGFATLVLHSIWELIRNRQITTPYTRWISQRHWQWSILISLLLYHILRLAFWGITGQLTAEFEGAPLYQLLASWG